MVREYLGEIPHMLVLRCCLVIHLRPLPEVIAGDGAPCTFGLAQDIRPYIVCNILSRLERSVTLSHWGARNKATQQICGKLGLQTSCPKPTQGPSLSFLSQWSTQNGFQERRVSRNTQPQEAPKSLMRVSQASLLEQSHCSLFARRYLPPAPRLCTPVAAAPSGS